MCRCRSRSRCRGRAAILWLIQHLALLVEQEQNMSPTTSGALRDATACGNGVAITRGNDIHGLRLLEEVFGRHRERKLCGLRPREVVPARRPARRRHTFARRHALYGGARSTAARSTAARSTAARSTAARSTAPARSTAARSRAALLQTEGVRELIGDSPSHAPLTVVTRRRRDPGGVE